jgi:hypothetical protein
LPASTASDDIFLPCPSSSSCEIAVSDITLGTGHCVYFTDSSADEIMADEKEGEESISLTITEKETNGEETEKNDSPDDDNLDGKDPKSNDDCREETVREDGEEMEEEGSVTQFRSMTRMSESESESKNIRDNAPVITPVPVVAGPPAAIVRIKIPSDPKKQQVIDLMADFVAREGDAFEEVKQIFFNRETSEFYLFFLCIVFYFIR